MRGDAPARYLEARQRAHPPRYQKAAGWKALFDRALSLAPPILRTRVANGLIASGEVGDLTPVACVTEVGRGYAVEMHSGLMRLIYSAARAMSATDSGRFRDDKMAALSAKEAMEHIAWLFRNYVEREIATSQVFPATEEQKCWAHMIAVDAETFLLMHELAHIDNEYAFWLWRPFRKKRDVLTLETQADETAMKWLIAYLLNPSPGGPPPQMLYAGAEFGLRVRMAMETVGMKFAPTHPPAGHRVATLRARFRTAAGPRRFYAVANTSLAFDQMWRAVELMLMGKPPTVALGVDDVLSSLRTLVAEAAMAGYIGRYIKTKENRLVFEPTLPRHVELAKAARDYLACVMPEIFAAAYERAFMGDVYEQGTDEFSLLLAFLDTGHSHGGD